VITKFKVFSSPEVSTGPVTVTFLAVILSMLTVFTAPLISQSASYTSASKLSSMTKSTADP
jgi:hypothetical protein